MSVYTYSATLKKSMLYLVTKGFVENSLRNSKKQEHFHSVIPALATLEHLRVIRLKT